MSVGSKNGGFSLNGTRRSKGYVGKTMLGRHFPRTPMRGNEARGSGGCCGKYGPAAGDDSGIVILLYVIIITQYNYNYKI